MKRTWLLLERLPLLYTAVALVSLAMLVEIFVFAQTGVWAIVAAVVFGVMATAAVAVTGRRRRRPRVPAAATQGRATVDRRPRPAAKEQPRRSPVHVPSPRMTGPIQQAFAAEPGWRAIFGDDEPGRTMSRLVGWAVTTGTDGATEVIGLIVDPNDPTRVVSAAAAVTPEGHTLTRYGFKDS